jgi:hypothetical protein
VGNQVGRLDALSRGSRLPVQAGMPSGILDLEDALVAADKIARSGMVPKAYTNPAAVLRTGMKGQAMGIGFWEAIDVIDPIDNRPVPNAQCRLGHIRHTGHEAEFVFDQCDRDRATIRGRRREHRNNPDGWKTVVYTIEEAEEAGLLDEWVEHKYRLQGDQYDRTEKLVLRRTDTGYEPAQLGAELPEWAAKEIKAGRVKRKDNWWKNRASMLRARAASTLYRMHFSDLMFSAGAGPYTAEEMGSDIGSDVDDPFAGDDDVVDGEIVEPEPGEDPGVTPAQMSDGGAPSEPAEGSAGPAPSDSIEPERGRDNGGAAIVGASTAPDPSGPARIDWRAVAKEHGVTVNGLLRKGREFAGARALPPPASIEEVTDEQVVADIMAWLGPAREA